MSTVSLNMLPLHLNAREEICTLLEEYEQFLFGKSEGTTDSYLRTIRHLIGWLALRPENNGYFQPAQLVKATVELYLSHLESEGLGLHHRARVKSTISNFANFLIEEKGLLQRNPTRGIDLPPIQHATTQQLSPDQRAILRSLVERKSDARGRALFALGYWAGCRVSDISWLQMSHTHVGPKVGWLHVGDKEHRARDIDLLNGARQPLYEYIHNSTNLRRTYVFTSQRSDRLTEEGIHYWFRTLKTLASPTQREMIQDLTFNDLRHDFACRIRESGWSLEEVRNYLGLVAQKGNFTSLW
ncbi:hypothetical protein KDW_46930 [Dictyobacter vulcani]|uniref:Integrase n=1 Tax=Dictyobacter vulcani TaxID=2607529 RepID=A0A5J4KVN4_9CHLR|nr:tyrosine-type recombinase/integrase [Dictyobacter vulcani]GER90531.1 hypothetical protein KDW_46930 [Dictyobacter vulcani]